MITIINTICLYVYIFYSKFQIYIIQKKKDIFMIIGTASFGKYDEKHFGSLFKTLFRLIQLMTLDDWSVIYQINRDKVPIIWFYLAIFIVLETFIFLKYVQFFFFFK